MAPGTSSRNPERSEGSLGAEILSVSEGSLGVGGSNSVVESQPSKLLVAGSIPVSRSRNLGWFEHEFSGLM